MRKIDKIIVHCSASHWGNLEEVRFWHLEKGWKDIGYHFLIENKYTLYTDFVRQQPNSFSNGRILQGRSVSEYGAHVKGMNKSTIGICLIGVSVFSAKQKRSLYRLLMGLVKKYKLSYKDVLGHYECPTGKAQGKTCPNLDMNHIRKSLKWRLRFVGYFK